MEEKLRILEISLSKDKKYLFDCNDYFSKEFFDFCKTHNPSKVLPQIAPISQNNMGYFNHWVKCDSCKNDNTLNTHHSTYNFHGYELQRWKMDLIPLCENCHSHYHSK